MGQILKAQNLTYECGLYRHYGTAPSDNIAELSFKDLPKGICWIVPEMDIARVNGKFWREWFDENSPKVIFLHRDPRATLVSMINFLSNSTGRGFGDYADFAIYNEIIESMPSLEEKVQFAISDKNFPGINSHARMRWMLEHPRILSVSYDDLVGEAGGGHTTAQHEAISSIVHHLGIQIDELPGSEIYSDQAYTFHQGQKDAWKRKFGPKLLESVNMLFDDILDAYGYSHDVASSLVVADSHPIFERVLKAKRVIKPGEVILDIRGCTELSTPTRFSVYAGGATHLDDPILSMLNHSCMPNVIIDIENRVVKAITPIEENEILTFFYPSTEWKQVEPFLCACGSANCLGEISGAFQVDHKVLEQYFLNFHIQERLAIMDQEVN